jgi:elongator complex protein 3
MREMGCTRIELGIQHTDDSILKLIKRGHDNARSKLATKLLKNCGYKTDFHLMPQLPGATPETDLVMLNSVFEDPGLRPDMIKVYPCSVIKNSELYEWFVAGKYKAYPTEDLLAILKKFKPNVPRYCRISRLIRDIPGQYIEDGNKTTNLRQVIQEQMKKEGTKCVCLRCREIAHADLSQVKDLTPHLFVDEYETLGGKEYFLSFEDKDRLVVFAFCRLRLVDKTDAEQNKKLVPFPAYIRELHTYGQLVKIGKQELGSSQHKGLGKKLVTMAEKITKNNGISKLAVISGVGVRDYYRQLGYKLENTYMVKRLIK